MNVESWQFHPTSLALAWTTITAVGAALVIWSATHIVLSVMPELRHRKAWDFGTVRSVVYNYLRRDVLRATRLLGYCAIGVLSMFSPPTTRPVTFFATATAFVLMFGVSNELLDALADFRYRQHWLRPIPMPFPVRNHSPKEKTSDE